MQVEQGRGILYWKIKNPGRMQKQVKGKQKRLGGEKRKRVGTLAFFFLLNIRLTAMLTGAVFTVIGGF